MRPTPLSWLCASTTGMVIAAMLLHGCTGSSNVAGRAIPREMATAGVNADFSPAESGLAAIGLLIWRRLAEQGNRDAQFAVADIYYSGHDVPQDLRESAKWFRLAAEQGHIDAQFDLGRMYFGGVGVVRDIFETAKWWTRAAHQGHAGAQSNLGILYKEGRGVRRDDSEAAKWFRLAAEQGDAEAQANLGLLYMNGDGVPQDEAEAARWTRLAADRGHAPAQNRLGRMYASGRGVPRDDVEALKWFTLYATQGPVPGPPPADPAAMAEMDMRVTLIAGDVVARTTTNQRVEAQRRARGWSPKPTTPHRPIAMNPPTARDYELAAFHLRPLAQQGDANAQFLLGFLYATAPGVTRNDADAVDWYRQAAQKGHAAAQNNLGAMYASGRGTGRDDAEAVKWYLMSADEGHTDAEFNLGMMYATGRGVRRNNVEAYAWLTRASHSPATRREVRAAARTNLSIITSHMTREEVSAGDTLIRSWTPGPTR